MSIKEYYKIKDVVQMTDLKATQLRYWESLFKKLDPKRLNQQRLYTKEDVILIKRIKDLLKNYNTKQVEEIINSSTNEIEQEIDNQNLANIISSLKQIARDLK